MKFSELWLRELVNPEINSDTLAEQMTMAGLQVDSIEPVAAYFTGVVVGHVVKCKPHPKTDKLQVTKVDIGNGRLLDIICSASNCRVNLRVVVATPGALLSLGGFKIKTIKVRDEPSEGMLCSLSELGIASGHNGIIELPIDATIGQNIRDYLKLDDNSINISVTANRADCLSLLGIARDIAARNRLPFVQPIINPVRAVIDNTLPIQIEAPNACPCYLGRVIKNMNLNTTTPLWMKEKLRRCGLHSVNALVDISNYVLLELGQPIHTFDRDFIEGGIIVRHAKQGDTLTLFDGRSITLTPETLVIADQKKVLSLAGIFGGAVSCISPTTKEVMLECAFFYPWAITGRARQYGLHTDASSLRYERGVDPEIQPRALERATALLVSICGGQPGPVINVTSKTIQVHQAKIALRRKTLDRLIGHVISDDEVNNILNRLGFQVHRTMAGWDAIAPSWRFDMAIEEDLIKEITRMYGYHAIPNIPIRANLVTTCRRKSALPLSRIKTLLVDRGYQEVITYSFVDPKYQALLHPLQAPLVLKNPISQDMSVMRLSLWTGLLGAVVYNQNRQQKRIRLFESGFRFVPDNSDDIGIRQDLVLSGVISGPRFHEHWNQIYQPVDFYDAKGDLETILELTGKLENIQFKAQRHLALHPGQSAVIYLKNEAIGFIGMIHPELETKLNLNGRTLVFEVLWEKLSEHKIPEANKISRFPANRRDIAVVVADDVTVADVITECKKIGANQVVSVNLFDVYRGHGVAKGFKSLAISLILQHPARTLKEKEIAATVAKCVTALKQRFQASLRN